MPFDIKQNINRKADCMKVSLFLVTKAKMGELLRFSNVNPATSSRMFCKTLRVEGE